MKFLKKFFKDSETILLARLEVLLGLAAGVVTYVDPTLLVPLFPAEWAPLVLVAHGLALEYLRRRRATDL